MKLKTYQLRAECIEDVIDFLNTTQSVLTSFTMIKPNDNLPDVVLIFQAKINLEEIKYTLREIQNNHVMYETVEYIENYTGKRK